MLIIKRSDFDSLIDALKARSYTIIGPTIRDNAVVYDELGAASDLPVGWTDEQEISTYRLKHSSVASLFGYSVGPYSWKRYLFPPRAKILAVTKKGKTMEADRVEVQLRSTRFAFIGVRSCELHAIEIQDKVFMNAQFSDPGYAQRRSGAFIVAVNCTQSSGTCFCTSMKTGPKVKGHFDLLLTEVLENGEHYFLAETGSEKGTEVLKDVPHKNADPLQAEVARKLVEGTKAHMRKTMKVDGVKELLEGNMESSHWEEVGRRCLMCANCTLVCPTCFCSTIDDITDLSGDHAERWRRWDSCFMMDFAKVTGGNFRPSPKARYRQWITHKFSSWMEQFGTSGCVGCGRCITWCPVGIDITAELQAIRNNGTQKEG